VSRAVSSLLRARRLRRRTAAGDRRRSVLTLSPAGEEIYAEVVPLALDHQRGLLAALSATDRAHLERILDRLLAQTGRETPTA
jgi:DNA-binding MarR family transcriptional regulator